MRSWTIATLAVLVAGCHYVSKDEFQQYWDNDGDGWSIDDDCDDANALIAPYANDIRGDGCDADCGLEADSDNDDWPDDVDCGANDPDVYPCAPDTDGDGVDSDCDGFDSPRSEDDVCVTSDPGYPDGPTENPCGGSSE